MTLSSLYQDFLTWVNTSQNGFFRPETDFERAANNASYALWNELTDEAENNQSVTDDLLPFIKTKNMIVSSSNAVFGNFNYPPDYGRFSAARLVLYKGITVGYEDCETCDSKPDTDEQSQYELVERYLDGISEVDVKKVNSSKWAAALSNLTKPPTLNKPIIRQTDKGAVVSPRKVSVVVLDYYTSPIKAKFVYTTAPVNTVDGSGGDIIFNDNASTPLQWNESVRNRLLEIIKNIYIGFTRDSKFEQISSNQKKLE